jgi:Ser/Thr protein kinase RdoA (MazF antagonist)
LSDLIRGRQVRPWRSSPRNLVLQLTNAAGHRTALKVFSDHAAFRNEQFALTLLEQHHAPAARILQVATVLGADPATARGPSAQRWSLEMTMLDGGRVHLGRDKSALLAGLAQLAGIRQRLAGGLAEVALDNAGSHWGSYLVSKIDGYAELLRHVRSVRVAQCLDYCRRTAAQLQVEGAGLVHADLSMSNLRRRQGSRHRVAFLDWELARWGDPLFDAAVLVQRGILAEIDAIRLHRDISGCAGSVPQVASTLRLYRRILDLRDLALVESTDDPALNGLRRRAHRVFSLGTPPLGGRRMTHAAAHD